MWAYGVHASGPLVLPPAPTGVAPPPAATGASMPRTAYAITPASFPELPAKPSEAPHCDPHDNHHRAARAPRLRPCPWPLPLRVPPRREAFKPPSPDQPPTPITGASPRPGPSGAGFRRPPACGRQRREGLLPLARLSATFPGRSCPSMGKNRGHPGRGSLPKTEKQG